MSTNPQNPAQTKTQNVLDQISRITQLAASAVLQAQQAGVGQSGDTKKQMALKIVHVGLQSAGVFIPGITAASNAEAQLEPIFVPLFTSFVNLFRSHGHPAFANPAITPTAPPSNP